MHHPFPFKLWSSWFLVGWVIFYYLGHLGPYVVKFWFLFKSFVLTGLLRHFTGGVWRFCEVWVLHLFSIDNSGGVGCLITIGEGWKFSFHEAYSDSTLAGRERVPSYIFSMGFPLNPWEMNPLLLGGDDFIASLEMITWLSFCLLMTIYIDFCVLN